MHECALEARFSSRPDKFALAKGGYCGVLERVVGRQTGAFWGRVRVDWAREKGRTSLCNLGQILTPLPAKPA